MMIDDRRHRRQRRRNTVQGVALLLGMVVIFGGLAWLLFGLAGLVAVVGVGIAVGLLRPAVPTGWVLRTYNAQPLPVQGAPDLHRAVAILAARAGLPRAPALYYVPVDAANAFATGSTADPAIALTDGILRGLTRPQVVAVLAHEISHIRAGDMRITNVSDYVARLTRRLSYAGLVLLLLSLPTTLGGGDIRPFVFGLLLLALPSVTTAMQMALSRSRDEADLEGTALTGDPEGLASALEALDRSDGTGWERLRSPRERVPDPALLRSHPRTAERARRLRQLASSRVPAGDRM